MPINLDWIRDPVLEGLTAFQRLIRSINWSDTALGPIESWPRELRQMFRLAVADTSPAVIYWGPERTIIYNEAFIPLIGEKHPNVLGMNAPDVFPDFWDYFETVLEEQTNTGQAVSGDASRLLMVRHGFLEETYFDWKLIPIISDDGLVLGSYGIPTDRTEDIIGLRRNLCVQSLSQKLAHANTITDFASITMQGLAQNEKDIPFAVLYSQKLSPHTNDTYTNLHYNVVGTVGVPSEHMLQNHHVDLEHADDIFTKAILEAINSGQTVVFRDDTLETAKYFTDIEWKGSDTPSKQFVVLPITDNRKIPAFLIIGINPYRRYNSWYQNFLQMMADVLSTQHSKIRLSEELKYRVSIAKQALQDFEKSETRFARFAGRSVIGLAVTDLNGKIIYANDAWFKFSGCDSDQMDTASWQDIVHEDDVPILQEWWHKVAVLKQNGSIQFRSKNAYKHGHMESPNRTGLCAAYADVDEDGIETVMGLVVDISEQVWIQGQLLERSRELELSEKKYRNFAEHAPLGIVRTDKEGYVVFGNDAWHNYYGFTKGNVPDPQPWLDYLLPDDVQKCRDFFTALTRAKIPRSVELRLKRRYQITEGDRLIEGDAWIIATGVAEWTEEDEVDHIDFWVTEISAQKMAATVLTDKMEEAIRTRTQQERFIDMISHEIRNPLSAVLHCGEEIVESMKQCLITMDGKTPTEALMAAKRSPDTEIMEKMINNALDAGNTIMYCVQHQKQIVDDVLTLSKLDSELLVVSPIPVQPLDLMHSCIKIFEPELRSSDINLSLHADDSLTKYGIVWILLDPNRFSQILINLITNAIKFTRASSTRKIDIKLSAHAERPDSPQELQYVPPRFRQLQRKVSYVHAASPQIEDKLYLRCSVSDTGKGLSSDEKKLLFKRFAQASPKTEVSYGGSGLGLFISRQITEMLGGEIGVGSSPSGGCIFAFYVATTKIDPPENLKDIPKPRSSPAVRAADIPMTLALESPKKLPSRLKEAQKPSTQETRKALVVEDNLVNQKVLCKQLRNRGFEVEATNHGREALEALERARIAANNGGPFDVCLCDIEMPIMDGIECVKEVRRLESEGHFPARIPIIGVTANVRSKQVDAALDAGMDGITTKPYRIDDLIAHIDRLCPVIMTGDG
ncbi:hypothetical protein H2198_005233 [Neophaeococcomyces mojaviensis]|uniref:Uncharacterized protein n=1 Tax=Neophaeococcomyces mojaviensis TaxID=3383035 RepID=A0ACC3A6H2_9EURO|nr:hypothetical protein H2198_005233 [Knufia sp. JES_112]